MALIKNSYLKFIFVLVCLSQVQGALRLIPDKPDSPFDEFFRELQKSVSKVFDKMQMRLTEADIHVEKYFDKLKDNVAHSEDSIHEAIIRFEENLDKFQKQIFEFLPKHIDQAIDEMKMKNPELAEKLKKLKYELTELKEDICKLFEELKKPFIERYNELRDEFYSKSKPIAKRLTPILKDIEDIVLTLIPDKNDFYKMNEIKKLN
ncbi:uncharacterized protein LOC126902628 [Daktulosphaira vitifoliae]|uniref:uncharacterized protein LOC126902628 n=1 Tax=Daktulosphaira vitifoliae TaxID=58002 RepID=UPI0021AAD3F3|nr:uncharacterized protein LOC126902628 [Daktulosphaira vitifoliae]